MKYSVDISNEANLEIIEAYLYYENVKTDLGERFLNIVQQFLNRIEENPFQFPEYRKPFREAYIIKFPYIIVFKVVESKVIIHAVFHAKRNPENKY